MPDAHQQGVPDAARQRPEDHPRAEDRRRLQRAVRTRPPVIQILPDRGESPRVALLGPRIEGQRLSDRARYGQGGRGSHPRRDHAGQYARQLRADARLRRDQSRPLPVRQVQRRVEQARYADESHGRGDVDRPHDGGEPAEGDAFARNRRLPYLPQEVRRLDERPAAGIHRRAYRRPTVCHRAADPRRRRSGADLQPHENRHVLPRKVQEYRRIRARRRGRSDGYRSAARSQAHGFQRQVHRPAVGRLAARHVPAAREERHLPGLQDDRHLRQRVQLLRSLFLLDLRRRERVAGERQGEDRGARFRSDPHRSGRRVRLFDRTRHLVDPRGGL